MRVYDILVGVLIVIACKPDAGDDTEGSSTTGTTGNATTPTSSSSSSSSSEAFECSDGILNAERGELCDGDEFHCDLDDGCRPRAFVTLVSLRAYSPVYSPIDTIAKMDEICTSSPPIYASPEIAYRAYVEGEDRPFDATQFPGAKLWSPCDHGCIDFPSIPVPEASPIQSVADVTQTDLPSLECVPPMDSSCYLPGYPPAVRVTPCIDGEALTYDEFEGQAFFSRPCSGESVQDFILCVPYRP